MLTVPTGNYTPGRIKTPRVIVLHTAEAACGVGKAEAVARYLARPETRASAHYVLDPATTVAQVAEADTAWAAPGANADGIQVEQCGYASWTAAEWADWPAQTMIRTQLVPLLRDVSARWQIPLYALTAADLLAGRSGVCDHKTINDAYHQSDHWDCGTSFPLAQVLSLANTQTPPSEADMTPEQATQLTRIVELLEAGLFPRGAPTRAQAVAVVGDVPPVTTGYVSEPWLWGARLEMERLGLVPRGGPAARADVTAPPVGSLAEVATSALLAELGRRTQL